MIPVAKPKIGELEKKYVSQAVESTWVSSAGEFIDKFEKKLANYLSTEFITTSSNGTTALHLALLSLGLKEGDEVILPACSFIATLNAILYTGATPVFVDVELETWGMDPKKVEDKITEKTKAILAVHLYGYACDILGLRKLADKHGLYLVEDNAESFGAEVDGKKLGTIGDIGTFSFFGNKIITTGEGGAICAKNKELMDKILLYKNHGRRNAGDYYHEVIGYNYRMTNLQAALGLAQLEQINQFLDRRREIENKYDQCLQGLITRQNDLPSSGHVNWLYSFVFKKEVDIDSIIKKIKEKGIDSRRLFYPMNKMPYLQGKYENVECDNSMTLYNNGLTLPTYVDLKDDEIEFICQEIEKVL